MNAVAGITGKPTEGIRDDAFEPPWMDSRRVGVRLPRLGIASHAQRGGTVISHPFNPLGGLILPSVLIPRVAPSLTHQFLPGDGLGLGAGAYPQLGVEVVDVSLDGRGGDEQLLRHLLVA